MLYLNRVPLIHDKSCASASVAPDCPPGAADGGDAAFKERREEPWREWTGRPRKEEGKERWWRGVGVERWPDSQLEGAGDGRSLRAWAPSAFLLMSPFSCCDSRRRGRGREEEGSSSSSRQGGGQARRTVKGLLGAGEWRRGCSVVGGPSNPRARRRSRGKPPSAKAPAFAIRAAFLWQRELKEVRLRNGKQRAIVRDRLSAVFHRGTAAPACSCETANPVHP